MWVEDYQDNDAGKYIVDVFVILYVFGGWKDDGLMRAVIDAQGHDCVCLPL